MAERDRIIQAKIRRQKQQRAARRRKNQGEDTHVVKEGESIFSIAGSQFGDQRFFEAILAANPHLKGGVLRPGQRITLPGVDAGSDPVVSFAGVGEALRISAKTAEAQQKELGEIKDPFRGFNINDLTDRGLATLESFGFTQEFLQLATDPKEGGIFDNFNVGLGATGQAGADGFVPRKATIPPGQVPQPDTTPFLQRPGAQELNLGGAPLPPQPGQLPKVRGGFQDAPADLVQQNLAPFGTEPTRAELLKFQDAIGTTLRPSPGAEEVTTPRQVIGKAITEGTLDLVDLVRGRGSSLEEQRALRDERMGKGLAPLGVPASATGDVTVPNVLTMSVTEKAKEFRAGFESVSSVLEALPLAETQEEAEAIRSTLPDALPEGAVNMLLANDVITIESIEEEYNYNANTGTYTRKTPAETGTVQTSFGNVVDEYLKLNLDIPPLYRGEIRPPIARSLGKGGFNTGASSGFNSRFPGVNNFTGLINWRGVSL